MSPELKIPIYADSFGQFFILKSCAGALNLIPLERTRRVDGPNIFYFCQTPPERRDTVGWSWSILVKIQKIWSYLVPKPLKKCPNCTRKWVFYNSTICSGEIYSLSSKRVIQNPLNRLKLYLFATLQKKSNRECKYLQLLTKKCSVESKKCFSSKSNHISP